MDTHPKSTVSEGDHGETHTIFFIGKPGCGKGTQAKLLSERTGWTVISAGQQFRAIAALDTRVGRKIKSEIEAGLLAPHWFAMYLFQKALFSLPSDASVIFDGFIVNCLKQNSLSNLFPGSRDRSPFSIFIYPMRKCTAASWLVKKPKADKTIQSSVSD